MNRAQDRAAPRAERGAVVVAARAAARCAALLALLPCVANAAILPEDRADVMYHGYDGGGLEVQRSVDPRTQGIQRPGIGVGELLRRHDQQRVDRCRCDGESVQGDA